MFDELVNNYLDYKVKYIFLLYIYKNLIRF